MDGEWKRVDGEKFFLVVKNGIFLRRVMIRDGHYSHSNDTLESSTCLKARGMSLEEQTMRTIDNYLSDKRSKERQIDNAVEKMDEVYRDDW